MEPQAIEKIKGTNMHPRTRQDTLAMREVKDISSGLIAGKQRAGGSRQPREEGTGTQEHREQQHRQKHKPWQYLLINHIIIGLMEEICCLLFFKLMPFCLILEVYHVNAAFYYEGFTVCCKEPSWDTYAATWPASNPEYCLIHSVFSFLMSLLQAPCFFKHINQCFTCPPFTFWPLMCNISALFSQHYMVWNMCGDT